MQKEIPRIVLGYLPRAWQQNVHLDEHRFKVLVLHRRAGKTVLGVNEIIDRSLRCQKRNPQYAYVGINFGSVKRIAWDMMKDYVRAIPGSQTNEQDLKVVIPREHSGDKITIYLLGSENPASIRGIYLDGVIMDEYSEMDPTLWGQVIRPALADRRGWAIFTFTPKGFNHAHEIWVAAEKDPENWMTFMLKASQSGILSKEELDAAKATMSEEEYEQEFECSFGAALVGAYYSKHILKAESEGRITRVPYDRAIPVDTFWDLGISDTTAIWFAQQVGKEFHIIDYLESSGVGLEWYAKNLTQRDYAYYEHVLPHDAGARELGTGKTREETLRGYGLGRMRILERQDVDDGIHAARMVLDKCWFDADKCKRGLDALRAYEKRWDAKNKIFMAKPLHNWASHGADAFRTFAMGNVSIERRKGIENLPRMSETEYDIFDYSRG